MILRGDGKGNFSPMSGLASGLNVPGDARGSAVANYDGDGRPDLAVAQNGAQTKLFHNTGAKPGLRVRLTGRDGNATALGAQIRIVAGDKSGPVRELHGGSGYWSQDSAVAVLAAPEVGAKLWTRWPGGKEAMTEIPAGARQVTATAPGDK